MTRPSAGFPSTIWDGFTANVPDIHTYASPMANDFEEIVAELVATQTQLATAATAGKVIWASPDGVAARATGSFTNPFATIAAALAAVTTTKKIVALLPGAYTLSAATALPTVDGTKIIGLGAVTIAAANANQAFSITPGAQGAAYSITLQGVTINQYAAKKGIYVDDTAIDGGVTINLKDVTCIMSSSGSSIDILHAVATQAVTLNCDNCKFTGPVTVDCINASDTFNFTNCILTGGLASDTGAVAASFKLKFCEVLHEGITGGAVEQTVYASYCLASTGALLNTDDLAGSHTETAIVPAS